MPICPAHRSAYPESDCGSRGYESVMEAYRQSQACISTIRGSGRECGRDLVTVAAHSSCLIGADGNLPDATEVARQGYWARKHLRTDKEASP